MLSMNTKLKQPRQFGFSLVEVMIALVIMSVGMLGIAGLYVQSMQAGRTSMFRHHAVNLAGDVADRIRANPRAAGAYTTASGVNNNCVAGTVVCTPTQMAENDILIWKDEAASTLPAGDVIIAFDNTVVPPTYTITVTWNEPGQNPAPSYVIQIPVLPI